MLHGGAGLALAGFTAPISAAFVGPTSSERCPSPSSRQPNSEVLLESADRALIRQVERIRSHRLSNHDGNRTRRSPGLEPQAGARVSQPPAAHLSATVMRPAAGASLLCCFWRSVNRAIRCSPCQSSLSSPSTSCCASWTACFWSVHSMRRTVEKCPSSRKV